MRNLKFDGALRFNAGCSGYPNITWNFPTKNDEIWNNDMLREKPGCFSKCKPSFTVFWNLSIIMLKISPSGRVTLNASAVLQAARGRFTTASRPAPCRWSQGLGAKSTREISGLTIPWLPEGVSSDRQNAGSLQPASYLIDSKKIHDSWPINKFFYCYP